MPSAYQATPYDSRFGTARMGDLIQTRGSAVAQGHLQRGAAAAQAWTSLGQIVSGTMSDLVKLKMDEPRRRYEQARMDKAEREERRASNLEGVMQMAGQLPPDEGIELLRREGYQKEAGELLKQVSEARRQALTEVKTQYEVKEQRLNEALNLLAGVEATPKAQRQTAYAAAVPKMRELVGDELAQMLPDQYDPAFTPRALEWGMSAKDKLATRREALTLAEKKPKDARDADEYFTKAGATWLSTVDSQEEWDQAVSALGKLGAAPETLSKFGTRYSPEAVAKAASFVQKERPPAAAGSFEDYVQTLEARNDGKPLSKTQMLEARREWNAAGRAPASGGRDLENTRVDNLRAAEQWKQREISNLEKAIRAGEFVNWSTGEQDAAAIDREKARIQTSYQAQLGMQPAVDAAPPPPPGPRNAGSMGDLLPVASHEPAGRPAPPVRPAGSPLGAGQAVAAPAPAPAGPAGPRPLPPPEPVAKALEGQQPGEYELSDGSVWLVHENGTIVQVK